MTTPRIIATRADLEEGLEALCAVEPRFQTIIEQTGVPALRLSEGGFPALLRIVTDQMISLKAAEAIWGRISKALHPLDHHAVLKRRHSTLMKLGLSGHKARSFRALAEATREGALALHVFHELDDAEIMRQLVAIRGIGPWTAEIYLLSCLGRADVWPAGDVALQHAAHHAFGLPERPGEKVMRELAIPWQPWRAVAARLLWAHYRQLKGLEMAQD